MNKVTGIADYQVLVNCPDCGFEFNAIQQEDDSEITSKMFENTIQSCTNMKVHLVCPKCDSEMLLDKLEY